MKKETRGRKPKYNAPLDDKLSIRVPKELKKPLTDLVKIKIQEHTKNNKQ